MTKQNRLTYIDLLKGIAIMLVVGGHFFPATIAPSSYRFMRVCIYSFHMPLFMMISGYLYALGRKVTSIGDYHDFVLRKAKRLLVPYATISLFVISVKLIFQNFFILENPVSWDSVWRFVFVPMGGFATFLWFIYTLFIIFLMVPLLECTIKNYLVIVFLSFGIYFLNLPEVFCLNLVSQYLIYFVMGIIIRTYLEKKQYFLINIGILLFGVSVLEATFSHTFKNNKFFEDFLKLTTSLSISFIIWWAVRFITKIKIVNNFFILLGTYSAVIYLFHTSVMAPVKLLLSDFMKLSEITFYISVFLVCTVGIAVPIMITQFIFNKNKHLSKLFLGVDNVS